MRTTHRAIVSCCCVVIAAMLSSAAPTYADEADAIVYSFVFFGCNRLDNAGIKATRSKSSANVAQLRQNFADIATLKPAPQLVVLAGDIVNGLTAGTRDLESQLPRWVKLVTHDNPLDFAATRVIAFTGNHELLKKIARKTEVPNQPAYAYWRAVMSPQPARGSYDFIGGSNGPTNLPPNADRLLNDESRLSYTLRSGSNLFVIVNTDSQIDATTEGNVPLVWLASQLRTAQADPAIQNIFVMGHKPILSPDTEDVSIREAQRADLYALLNNPAGDGTPGKVRGYFSAHAHEWQYLPSLRFGNSAAARVPQIVAGNAGSPPDKNWRGPDAYFGYTRVTIARSGVIRVESFGRDIPSPYYRQVASPATVKATHVIYSPPR